MSQGPAKDYAAIGSLPDWEALIMTMAERDRRRGPIDDPQLQRLHKGCEPQGCRFRRTKSGGFEAQKELVLAEDLQRSRPFASEPWLRCERCLFSYYGDLEHDKSILAAYGVKTEAPPKEYDRPARYQAPRKHYRRKKCFQDVNMARFTQNGSTKPKSA